MNGINATFFKKKTYDWRPIAVGCDLPGLRAETTLNREQRDALNDDLRSTAMFASPTAAVGAGAQSVGAIHQDYSDNHGRPPR